MGIEELRGLIGTTVSYRGIPCCVIEVLEDGPSLVLLDRTHDSVQADQFGEPWRQLPDTHVVPVWQSGGQEFHEEFLALQVLDIPCS
ncbi:MAG: hypothetical protein AB7U81_11300 [Thiohalomonadaceae bacterium]